MRSCIESHQPSGRRWFSGMPSQRILLPRIPLPSGEGFTPSLPFPVDPGRADISRLGSLLTSKTPSRSDQKIHQFFNRFCNPFWQHFCSNNRSQNHPKSCKNQSKTESGLKNVIFRKIAPRLRETLILEGPGSPKPSQNRPKTLQKPIKNPT